MSRQFKTKVAEIIIKNRKWKYDLESLEISRNIVGESAASFTLTFFKEAVEFIDIGTPVYIYMTINGARELIFGGVLSNLSSNPIKNGYKSQLFLDAQCEGFSVLLERRNTYFQVTSPISYKQLVQQIRLIVANDGILEGIIENDEKLPVDYKFEGGTVAEFLDDLAGLCGYIWYIDQYRKLYFVKEYPKNNKNYDFINKKEYELQLSSRNYEDYYNKVIVQCQKFNVTLEDTAEINRMSALLGSGVYGTILREKELNTPEDANKLATEFLEKHSYIRQEFTLQTREYIELNNEFIIKWQGFDYKVIATEVNINQNIMLPFFIYKLENLPILPKKLKYSFWKEEIKTIVTSQSVNSKKIKTQTPFYKQITGGNFELTQQDDVILIIECDYIVPNNGKGNIEILLDGKFFGTISTGQISNSITRNFQTNLDVGKHNISARIEALSSADINAGFVQNRLTRTAFFIYSDFLKSNAKSIKNANDLIDIKSISENFNISNPTIIEFENNKLEIY